MPWICPECKRQFKNRNQEHSCVRIDPDDLFVGKDSVVRKTYDKLLKAALKFGDVNVSPVRIGVMLKSPGTFVAIKPKKGMG